MSGTNFIAQLDRTIEDLRRKRDAIDALLCQIIATREHVRGLSPELRTLFEGTIVLPDNQGTPIAVPPSPPTNVVLSLESSEDEEKMPPLKYAAVMDLAGTSIMEAAITILREHNGDMHFTEIAIEALERGYSGRKSGWRTTRQSFWATMNRHKDLFEATGEGKYRLREKGQNLSLSLARASLPSLDVIDESTSGQPSEEAKSAADAVLYLLENGQQGLRSNGVVRMLVHEHEPKDILYAISELISHGKIIQAMSGKLYIKRPVSLDVETDQQRTNDDDLTPAP